LEILRYNDRPEDAVVVVTRADGMYGRARASQRRHPARLEGDRRGQLPLPTLGKVGDRMPEAEVFAATSRFSRAQPRLM
jgi:hypothetical protein